MTSSKSTKRALISSTLAILMCVAMLIGTTFAWFTDTASTGVNKIQAGNLKMEVSYKNTSDGEFTVLNESTNVFKQDTLWEPGHVEYAVLNVKNIGTLALKYKLGINIAGETGSTNVLGNEFKLSDYIKFGVVDEDLSGKTRDEMVAAVTDSKLIKEGYSKESHLDTTNAYETVTLVVWMPTDVGNKANYKVGAAVPEINLGINVAATQYTHESDSYDNQYDKNAQYPDVAYVAVSAPTAEDIAAGVNPLANALISGSTETGVSGEAKGKIAADLAAGTFKLTDKEGSVRDAVKGMEVTLNGAGTDKTTYEVKKANATGEGAADYSFDGAKAVVFKNMTVEFGLNTDFQGFVRAGAVRFENCTIKGMGANWGVGDVVFDNCNFVFPEGGNEWTYNLWTYGGSSFTFNNCTFTSDIGKFINVYRQGNDGVVDVTLNDCKFINKAASANKAAVKINGDHAWNVTIKDCTTDGVFPTDNSGLWQIENAVAGNQITVNGVLAYSK